MVNFSTIAIIGGLGLLIFFKEDVGKFLNQFKGFGQDFGKVELPDININVPDFGLPKVFADTGKGIGETGEAIGGALGEAGENIGQFGADVQKNIFDAGVEARKVVDTSIKETQDNFEQFGKDVQTNIDIIGTGITDFFGGIFPTKEITTVSETTPTITSRRAGTTTRFGGQTAPKEILTKETAITPELIVSEQPDLSLVSPFLKTTQTIEEKPETTTTTSRFSGSGSRR